MSGIITKLTLNVYINKVLCAFNINIGKTICQIFMFAFVLVFPLIIDFISSNSVNSLFLFFFSCPPVATWLCFEIKQYIFYYRTSARA